MAEYSKNEHLLFSAEVDGIEGMRAALESGADINTCDEYGESPLTITAREEYLPGVKFLLDSGADTNNSSAVVALNYAIMKDSMEIAQLLVSSGVSLTSPNPSDGWTPLACAAYLSLPETLIWILSHGVEIDARDLEGMTPLIHAVCSGSTKKVSILLDAGADKELKDSNGYSAMDWARDNKFEDIINQLL